MMLWNILSFLLIGKAGAPHFKSHEEGTEEHTYSLEWVTESKTPIIAFKLKYREDDGDRSFLKARMPKSYYSYTTVSIVICSYGYTAQIVSLKMDNPLKITFVIHRNLKWVIPLRTAATNDPFEMKTSGKLSKMLESLSVMGTTCTLAIIRWKDWSQGVTMLLWSLQKISMVGPDHQTHHTCSLEPREHVRLENNIKYVITYKFIILLL